MRTVTLDHDQRRALREELQGGVEGFTGGALTFDRVSIRAAIDGLQTIADALDVIGWDEPDAPHEMQTFPVTSALTAWAQRRADALAEDLRTNEEWRTDEILEGLAVLNTIGDA